MPIYEYHCEDCQQLFEHWQKNFDPQEIVDCPICKGTGRKVISNTSFVLKGGGWYVTDYGNRKESKDANSADAGANTATGAAATACATPAAPVAANAANS